MDITIFLDNSNNCVDLVKKGLYLSDAQLYEIVGRKEASSVKKIVSDIFSHCNIHVINNKLNIYFSDQINPCKVTEYLINYRSLPQEHYEYIYGLVCHLEQKKINKFYKDLKQFEQTGKFSLSINFKEYEDASLSIKNLSTILPKKYKQALSDRIKYPFKRIRG